MNLQTVDAEAGNRGTSNKKLIVPEKGFEPPRPCEQVILSHPCLPFHHSGSALYYRAGLGVCQSSRGYNPGVIVRSMTPIHQADSRVATVILSGAKNPLVPANLPSF